MQIPWHRTAARVRSVSKCMLAPLPAGHRNYAAVSRFRLFESKSAPDRFPWRRTSPQTVRRKARHLQNPRSGWKSLSRSHLREYFILGNSVNLNVLILNQYRVIVHKASRCFTDEAIAAYFRLDPKRRNARSEEQTGVSSGNLSCRNNYLSSSQG